MAQIAIKTAGADIVTNAAALAATDSDITEAQYTALGNLLQIIGDRRGADLAGPMKLLTDTDKAALALT